MKKIVICFWFLVLSCQLYSQTKTNVWDRIVFGGGLGAQFGDITLIQVSPNIGYLLTDDWVAGIGLRYMFLKNKIDNYETSIYGGSVYTQYFILDNYIAHAEVENLSLEAYDIDFTEFKRRNVVSVLVGGGLKMPAGANSFITLLVLWNLNESHLSPYNNPIIRAGLAIGI